MHHIKPTFPKANGKQKQNRGFSVNELKAAGVSIQQARNACLPVDVRRSSQRDQNIEAIKAHLKP